MMRVAAKALSVFCPHCQKRASMESLRIVGAHPGRLLATCGDILVEAASQLNVEIVANNVTIRGRVNGCVSANECLEVESSGRIYGDVRAAKLVVRDGGVIQGRIEMLPSLAAKQAAQKAADRTLPDERSIPPLDSPHGHAAAPSPVISGSRPVALPRTPQQIRPIQLD